MTDVLAFNFRDDAVSRRSVSKNKNDFMNGEIIIGAATAFRQAKLYKTSFYEEVVLYIIHGILHLLGYDDHTPADIRVMRKKEQELMTTVRSFVQKDIR